MLETMRNAWKIDELRKKILFTLFIVLLYRIGNAVPVPYVNVAALRSYFDSVRETVFGLYNVMSGGAFSNATIFALSIQPYINASIIMQLLTIAIPALERIQNEGGEEGKKKIASVTRYATVGIGFIQGFAYYMLMRNYNLLNSIDGLNSGQIIFQAVVIVLTFTAGSALIMWLGEQITEFGIGNGISIILFASIVSRFPNQISQMISNVTAWVHTHGFTAAELATAGKYASETDAASAISKALPPWMLALMLIGALAIIVLIVIATNAERRIPIQYSKRVVGRKMYGGQSTHLPMQVSMSGVMPIIFAQSIASMPATILMLFQKTKDSPGFWGGVLKAFNTSTPTYAVLYMLLIIFFAYFYSTIQFNPVEIANNLRKNGGFIPGYRPGRPTSDFIQRVLNKITLFGAIYLGIVAVVPLIVSIISPSAANAGISLGGTSIIIVIGVALETVKALEAQMIMRNYKGFLE